MFVTEPKVFLLTTDVVASAPASMRGRHIVNTRERLASVSGFDGSPSLLARRGVKNKLLYDGAPFVVGPRTYDEGLSNSTSSLNK